MYDVRCTMYDVFLYTMLDVVVRLIFLILYLLFTSYTERHRTFNIVHLRRYCLKRQKSIEVKSVLFPGILSKV